jgi:hypothetical protein
MLKKNTQRDTEAAQRRDPVAYFLKREITFNTVFLIYSEMLFKTPERAIVCFKN